ncbi:MAG: DedA family protein [Cyanobacteria bacterium M5B4]|nr:MAG: DedA family protein [Cyanobacteria bacterium M5B4]
MKRSVVAEVFDLETLLDLAHRYGYGIIFGGILLENAGIPLPGETLTLIGGFLAGNRELNYWAVLLSAIGGAILGDSCGYWLGRWGGMTLISRIAGVFAISSEQIEQAREKFNANCDRAVFFGRFIALLRIFAGPLAGMAGMSYPRFLVFNSLGAISWGVTMTSLAYFCGKIIPLADLVSYILRFSVLALIGVIIWFWRSRKKQIDGHGVDCNDH